MSQTSVSLPPALDLRGRRALVTGAASGIGRASALALAQLGAELLLTDRAPLAGTHAEIEGIGATCTIAEGDLTSDAFVTTLFAGGRVHAVAHCAAILDGRNWREDPNWHERFHRVMDINVRVPLTLTAAAIDHMAEHGGGAIVLVGSVAGRTGGTSNFTPPDYAASKGAVHALVEVAVASGDRSGRAGERRRSRARADADDHGLHHWRPTAAWPHGTAGRAGLADRIPLHAGGKLFLRRDPRRERWRVRRLSLPYYGWISVSARLMTNASCRSR
jgi:hypothetical protein